MKTNYWLAIGCTFLLAACSGDDDLERDRNEMVIIPMEGWNLTEHKIQSFSANNNTGYVVVPKVWNPNFKLKLRWTWSSEDEHEKETAKETWLSLPEYNFYEDFCGLKVFFIEADQVLLKTTCKSPVLLTESYARCERIELKNNQLNNIK
ncbi:DUF3304 domain-containing protein [Pseudomonas sp. F1_0610]|uniref:DUF3304 domain-containing protein n=1 Tax=Pseudomonas sp. F1_0610 TaxID=3114284 RepID=UPI0039C2EF78